MPNSGLSRLDEPLSENMKKRKERLLSRLFSITKKSWNKVKVIPIVVGALGTIRKGSFIGLGNKTTR